MIVQIQYLNTYVPVFNVIESMCYAIHVFISHNVHIIHVFNNATCFANLYSDLSSRQYMCDYIVYLIDIFSLHIYLVMLIKIALFTLHLVNNSILRQ